MERPLDLCGHITLPCLRVNGSTPPNKEASVSDFAVKDLMVSVLPERIVAECNGDDPTQPCTDPPSEPPCEGPTVCTDPPSEPPCNGNTDECDPPRTRTGQLRFTAEGPEFEALSAELEQLISGS